MYAVWGHARHQKNAAKGTAPSMCVLSSAENSAKPRHTFLRISGIIPITWQLVPERPEPQVQLGRRWSNMLSQLARL